MLLSRLIRGIALTDQIGRDVEITSLTCDSRTVSPGGLFAAFRGEKTDGTQFIQEALDRGAAAVLCAQPPDRPGPWLLTSDPRAAFGQMAANWFGCPGDRMSLVGVTGTNGKTTTTCMRSHKQMGKVRNTDFYTYIYENGYCSKNEVTERQRAVRIFCLCFRSFFQTWFRNLHKEQYKESNSEDGHGNVQSRKRLCNRSFFNNSSHQVTYQYRNDCS